MSAIDSVFTSLRRDGRKALIPFLTGGFPSLQLSLDLSLDLARRGADILEIGVPFSDPIADGPTIQAASQSALAAGMNLERILRLVEGIKDQSQIPVVIMSYYNPILRWGVSDFVAAAKMTGVDGLLVPDLPPEEAGEMLEASDRFDLDPIFLLAPNSAGNRIRLISRISKGYIYYTSVTGVTGIRRELPSDLKSALLCIRGFTKKPVAVGFGISTPAQASRVAGLADGVIIGSALIAQIQKNVGRADLVAKVGAFFDRFRGLHFLRPNEPVSDGRRQDRSNDLS